MSFQLIHDCAIGARIRPVSTSGAVAYFTRRKCRPLSRFNTASSRQKKSSIGRISFLTPHQRYLNCLGAGQAAQTITRCTILGSPPLSRGFQCANGRTPYSRRFSSKSNPGEQDQGAGYNVTSQELRLLVDEPHAAPGQDSYHRNAALRSTVGEDDILPPQSDLRMVETENDTQDILKSTRRLKLALRDRHTEHQHLWDIYQSLPAPRAGYLTQESLGRLLSRLQEVEYKSTPGMLRFLALISDMKDCGLGIPLHAWNSAISFAGRCLKKITANEVESALRIWREMENVAKVSSNNVTFNILFDVATKARKFVLAEMIMSEMSARKLTYNRYFRTGLIYYYGLRADGNNVRKAYSELLDAGEIVDTAVINCVIAALISCGEVAAADLIFERAKQLHASKTDAQLPPSHWRAKRRLGRKLDNAARELRDANEGDPASESSAAKHAAARVREETSVAPDLTTYKLFIKHYSVVLGDIDRTAQLVDEMEEYDIPTHGSVFRYIFHAFGIHGGILYSQWTRKRLENTWLAFVAALDAQVEEDVPSEDIDVQPSANHEPVARTVESPFFETNESIQSRSAYESNEEAQFTGPQEETDTVDELATELDPQTAHDGSVSTIATDVASDTAQGTIGEIVAAEDLEDPNRLLESTTYYPEIVGREESPSRPEQNKVMYMGRAMAELVGRAFAKCTNLGRTAEVWAEVKTRWTPEVLDDVAVVEAEIAALFPGHEELFAQIVELELRKAGRR